ncbi:MAG: T9SS type A sorting domain-containing protein [candidate division Zixibacteria bacterium]|nr:T9SS type A sorting domain-containing protein [Candidatus Tariuqbacter arcticus]
MLKVSICSTALFLLYISAFAQPQPPDTLWTRTFGGYDGDFGYSIQQTMDGGYIITGYTYSHGAGSADVCLIKTDANGNELWSQTFGGSSIDCGLSIQQTSDGGYIIAGYTGSYGAGNSDVYLIKTDASGNEQWTQTFGGSSSDFGWSVQQTSDGGFIIAGHTTSYGVGGDDVYLIRLDSEGSIVEEFSENQPSVFALHPPHPNPFNSSTAISWQLQAASFVKLAVYDIQGREVAVLLNQQQAAGSWQLTWDAEGMESGVYFVWLAVDGGQSMVRKVVLIK